MKKYTGSLLTTGTNLNNERMSHEAIESILQQQPRVPVTVNFNGEAIGHTISYRRGGDVVYCTVEIDETKYPWLDDAYFGISATIDDSHREGKITVIDEAELREVTITLLPNTPNLTKIKPE